MTSKRKLFTLPAEALQALMRYIYVAALDKLWDRVTRQYLSVGAACRRHAEEYGEPTDVFELVINNASAVRKVDRVNFRPKQDEIYTDARGGLVLNFWRPTDLKPVEGDATRFLQHVSYILDGDEDAAGYVLDYFAHLVQRPEIKIGAAILIVGAPGIGKSMVANVMSDIVGQHNARSVNPTALVSNFNDWIDGALLVVVHELFGVEPRRMAANLKEWITEPVIQINRKGIALYQSDNFSHFILLSNEKNAVPIDADDRRFFVWHSQAEKMPDAYYAELAKWLREGGTANVLDFLQKRDLTHFDPFAAPPKTASFAEHVREAIPDIQAYLSESLESGSAPFDSDLVVLTKVYRYCRENRIHARISDIQAVIERHGGRHLGQKRNVLGVGTKPNVWAVRNAEDWMAAAEADIARHYRAPGSVLMSAPQPARQTVLDLDG